MNIRVDTPDRLVIEHTSWPRSVRIGLVTVLCVGLAALFSWAGLLGFTLLCGVIALACAALLYFVTERSQLVLDRANRLATLRRGDLFGFREVRHDLVEVAGVSVDTVKDKNDCRQSRLDIIIAHGMSAGVHPLTRSRQPFEVIDPIATTIGRWLDLANDTA